MRTTLRTPRGHRTAELRSIELHRLVAERLGDAAVIDRARGRVDAWIADGGPVPPAAAAAWRDLLALPRHELAVRLVEDSERMRELRQNTPFAGVVGSRERWEIIRRVR